jgi:hypothetical protein
MTLYLHSSQALLPKPEVMMPAVYFKSRDQYTKKKGVSAGMEMTRKYHIAVI